MNLSEFLSEFQLEAGEKLDLIGSQLLRLERNVSDTQPVREMFLAAHTIKGGAAMLRLTDVEALAHALEDLLSSFRDHTRVLDGPTADLLFETIDQLRALVTSAASTSVAADLDPTISTFASRLRVSASGRPPSTTAEVEQARRAPRALLVDNSPTVRELHRLLLADAGFEVAACEDGQVALSFALAESFALVVVGVQTGGLGGFELTSALRANPAYRNVPVILTSADADPELSRRAVECGARGLVRKGSLQDERLSDVLQEIELPRAA